MEKVLRLGNWFKGLINFALSRVLRVLPNFASEIFTFRGELFNSYGSYIAPAKHQWIQLDKYFCAEILFQIILNVTCTSIIANWNARVSRDFHLSSYWIEWVRHDILKVGKKEFLRSKCNLVCKKEEVSWSFDTNL